ncbi:hypothetical protein [Gordonia shandongensis]|uniref:hypothetical protein n=1 Tax=Gordonia shandongensis TaxID=376351 RepID=UPI000408DA2F|nr:hypothetical protein [Gordonia shandongensis]
MSIIAGLTVAAAVVGVLEALRVVGFFWPLVVSFWGLPLLGGAWLALTVAGLFLYRGGWPLMVAPVIVGVGAAAVLWSGLPSRAQFALSESALNDAADTCVPAEDVRVGLYRFTDIERSGEFCLFVMPDGFIDRVGLTRMRQGPPPDLYQRLNLTVRQYRGDWYTFTWRF